MKAQGILYVRVSSDDQVRGVSLDDQVNSGRAWFDRHRPELEVVPFCEPGESARTERRPALQQALRYVEQSRGRVKVFLVYDLSRFARDHYGQMTIERRLIALGVEVQSVSLHLSNDAHGRAVKGYFGVTNQFLSDIQAEKISSCMLEATRQGRCMHRAPIGYRNERDAEGRAVVVIDPERGDLIRAAFARVAAGDGLRETLRWLTARGARGPWGGTIAPQRFRYLLSNPFYIGKVRSVRHGVEADGRHPALIDLETWSRVQQRLGGRPAADPPGVVARPDFPLRGFVRCARCGRPLTASYSRGKMGVRYGYYSCWSTDCGAVRGRKEQLHGLLLDRLAEISIAPERLRGIAAALERRWRDAEAEAERSAAAAKRRIAALEQRRDNLTESYALERAIDLETYDRLRRQLDAELAAARLELGVTRHPEGSLTSLLAFVEPHLTGLSNTWILADPSRRRRLQRLVWPAGATFDGSALRTPVTASVFRCLGGENDMKERLVEETVESWNSIVLELLALHEVLAA